MTINHVAFVANPKPLNIFSFNVHMPCFCRATHMILEIKPPRNAKTYLMIDFLGTIKFFDPFY
jgi:hypothetical protein